MELARSNSCGSRVARPVAQYSKPEMDKNFACAEAPAHNQLYIKFEKSSSFADEGAWLAP